MDHKEPQIDIGYRMDTHTHPGAKDWGKWTYTHIPDRSKDFEKNGLKYHPA